MSEMSAGVRNLQGALRRGWQRTPRTLHALFREDAMRNWCQHPTRTSIIEVQERSFAQLLGPKPRKNSGSHIDGSHSRQPLVKGERLVRNEVNAVMPHGAPRLHSSKINEMSTPLLPPKKHCAKRQPDLLKKSRLVVCWEAWCLE